MRARPPSRRLVVAGLLLAGLVITPVLGASGVKAAGDGNEGLTGGPYVAESLWSVRGKVGLAQAWWTLRPLWQAEPLGRGVRIGLVDTGIDASHPDLQGVIEAWIDLAGDKTGVQRDAPYDDHGHGTHVAGILAGRGHFQPNPTSPYWVTGTRGIAPEASLIVAKAMRADGHGDDALVAQAIDWAVDPNGDGDLSDGADVINLSIGMQPVEEPEVAGAPETVRPRRPSLATEDAVGRAISKGVVIVVSSGNGGDGRVTDPGTVRGVIAVGAVDGDDNVVPFSNGGAHLDLVAPGVLASTYPLALDTNDGLQDGYVGMAGTSMAAPVVTGVVARMMEADPQLRSKSPAGAGYATVLHIEKTLRDTARHLPGAQPERQGWGVLDAGAALRAVDRGGGADIVNAYGLALVTGAPLLLAGLVARPLLARGRASRASRAPVTVTDGTS